MHGCCSEELNLISQIKNLNNYKNIKTYAFNIIKKQSSMSYVEGPVNENVNENENENRSCNFFNR
jgi:hypothetical protein